MAKTSSAKKKSNSGAAKKSKTSNGATKTNEMEKDPAEEQMKLFEHGLKDMYWVEKSLTRSIPKMIKKAESEELQSALEEHLTVTKKQVEKLEKVFQSIGKTARAKKCTGMEGILKEGEEIMEEFDGPVIDSAIIAAAQKVEHYEMSSYISMITLAETMGMSREAQILQQVLEEEMEADETLTTLAASLSQEVA
jgi:ferritin-like metal-binding protein YciE